MAFCLVAEERAFYGWLLMPGVKANTQRAVRNEILHPVTHRDTERHTKHTDMLKNILNIVASL